MEPISEVKLDFDGKLAVTLRNGSPIPMESDISACRRIFGGRVFTCRGHGCLKEIEWIGVCDDCVARIENVQRSEAEILDDRLTGIGIPVAMTSCSWDEWQQHTGSVKQSVLDMNSAVNRLKDWTGSPSMVVISGPSGTGKTHLAIATARRFIENNGYSRTLRFWNEFSLVEAIKASFGDGDDVLAAVMKTDLFILDDFGSVQVSDWSASTRAGMLSRRTDDRKWTIVTTNLNHAEINAIDERLASRMRQALIINMTGVGDARRPGSLTESQKWIARGSGAK